jgi:hypothetical protein
MRTRSKGWKAAKKKGHQTEDLLSEKVFKEDKFREFVYKETFGEEGGQNASVEGCGINAKKVPSVLPELTDRKADLRITWQNGKTAGFSIKNDIHGQVYLPTVSHFIEGCFYQYNLTVPENVKLMLRLFIGDDEKEWFEYSKKIGFSGYYYKKTREPLERHQKRFCAETLCRAFPKEWDSLVIWFRENIKEITSLSFCKGLCLEREHQADYYWVYTFNKRNAPPINRIISIEKIISSISKLPDEKKCFVGPKNGGTTLWLPFGTLQMHSPGKIKNRMQFRHELPFIEKLINE